MTCAEARDLYSDWLDGTLGGAERRTLASHLEACPECRRDLERLRQTVALVRDLGPVRAPAGFAERVLGALERAPRRRRVIQRLFLPLPVKLPLQAAAVVLVAMTAVFLFQRTHELERAARREEPAIPAPLDAARPAPGTEGRKAPEPVAPAAEPPSRSKPAEVKTATEAPPAPAERRAVETAPPEGRRQADAVAPVPAPAPGGEDTRGRTQRDEDVASRPSVARPQAFRAEKRAGEPLGAVAAADIAGVLRAPDREAARAAVEEVLARVGGRQVSRRDEPDAVHLELVVPREGWAEFARGLERIGPWTPERLPPALPHEVRLRLRIGG